MTTEIDPFAAPIVNKRPLLGRTLLLIEDSRFCSEAVRLMALRCGARLRRADSVRAARKHLAMYCPDMIMVDLGLPDGSGVDLIRELKERPGHTPPILVTSGSVDCATRQMALDAGANGFISKPIRNLKHFQSCVLAVMSGSDKVVGFVQQNQSVPSEIDVQALLDDLDHVRDLLEVAIPSKDIGQMRYCAQFVSSVAQSAGDTELATEAQQFFQRMDTGGTDFSSGEAMLDVLHKKLADKARDGGVAHSVA